MRLMFIAVVVTAAWVLPLAGASVMRRHGSPQQVIGFSLASLAAMGAGLIVGLGAILDPGALPVRDLPALLGRCVDAAGRILEHPVRHWPRIMAAFVLLAVLARLAWSWIASVRDARSRSRMLDAIGREAPSADVAGMNLILVPAEEPFAFTVGLRRRRVIVSTPVLSALGTNERMAVLAHEIAHVRGWHPALLSIGMVLSRAFPFIRPVRVCADQLLIGIEMAADQAAARAVGDPLIVARALLALAPYTPKGTAAVGVTGTDLGTRVERLTSDDPATTRGHRVAPWMMGSAVTLASVLLLVLPASAQALTGDGRVLAIHAACHLPHTSTEVRTAATWHDYDAV